MKKSIIVTAILAAAITQAHGAVFITEVAPWSSSNSVTILADWFELTNNGAASVNISGWRMDDNSNSFASSVALSGITSIGAGESVIFLESSGSNPAATVVANFKSEWFGANVPANLQFGTYQGSGLGLSSSGDAVNVFDGSGMLQANVSFGASPTVPPFQTFDNSANLNNATISQLSVIGVNGAFAATLPMPNPAVGSPGVVPEASSFLLLALGAGCLAMRRRTVV